MRLLQQAGVYGVRGVPPPVFWFVRVYRGIFSVRFLFKLNGLPVHAVCTRCSLMDEATKPVAVPLPAHASFWFSQETGTARERGKTPAPRDFLPRAKT